MSRRGTRTGGDWSTFFPPIPVLRAVYVLFRRRSGAGGMPCLDFDLAAKILDDALKLPQPLHQLYLALAALFWRRIRVFRSQSSRCPSRRWEDARNMCLAAVATWHMFVASHLATATCNARPRIQGRRRFGIGVDDESAGSRRRRHGREASGGGCSCRVPRSRIVWGVKAFGMATAGR